MIYCLLSVHSPFVPGILAVLQSLQFSENVVLNVLLNTVIYGPWL